jgi:hypothetical protein
VEGKVWRCGRRSGGSQNKWKLTHTHQNGNTKQTHTQNIFCGGALHCVVCVGGVRDWCKPVVRVMNYQMQLCEGFMTFKLQYEAAVRPFIHCLGKTKSIISLIKHGIFVYM